jgi:hypothetical protein
MRDDLDLGRREGVVAHPEPVLVRADRRRRLLRSLELERAMAVEDALGALSDEDPETRTELPSLTGLARLAPPPWSDVLELHARELRTLVRSLETMEDAVPLDGPLAPRSLCEFLR